MRYASDDQSRLTRDLEDLDLSSSAPRPLDPRQLECFIVVAEELNLKRAATRLYMSQPPLTRRIRKLEQDIGVDLFRRSANGMHLTDAGSELLARAYRIVELSHRAVASTALAESGELGALEIGYYDPAILTGIPDLINEFLADNQRVDVRFHMVSKVAQIDYLRDHTLHLGFGRDYVDHPHITALPVVAEDLYVAYRADVFHFDQDSLAPEDLRGHPLVVYPLRRGGFVDEVFARCRSAGFTPTVAAEAEDMVPALAYVALGTAVAIVPESGTHVRPHGVDFIPLTGVNRATVTCVFPDSDRSATLELFVAFLEQRLATVTARA